MDDKSKDKNDAKTEEKEASTKDSGKAPGNDQGKEQVKEQVRGKLKQYKKFIVPAVILLLLLAGFLIWNSTRDSGPGEGFAGGNGRIEATEIDISAKLAGRIEQILVQEGDFVQEGQVLVRMQTDVLVAQLNEAKAEVELRKSDKLTSEATVLQRLSELDQAERKYNRSASLVRGRTVSAQEVDDDETRLHGARAAVEAAKAQVVVAQAAIESAEANVARIQADIDDSTLTAPRAGRIQYRIAQPGEVLSAGGKVLNLVDLADVYMTFFLPEQKAGRVALGSEARIVLDAAPEYPLPATISFVASTAQFTPKTVETQDEREKLMFRVKAQINPALLDKYITQVKVGLPGVTWVRIDPSVEWPEELALKGNAAAIAEDLRDAPPTPVSAPTSTAREAGEAVNNAE